MVLFLNEEYEAIYWRSSMANGAIVVWVPAEQRLLDMQANGSSMIYSADTPECIAYQCCPSPYSLKYVAMSAAIKYGEAHPRPKMPPVKVLDAVWDDIEWWRQLAFDSERYARLVGEGPPRKYFLDDATVVLKEMWRRTLGKWAERHDKGSIEMRLIRYLRWGRMNPYPADLARQVVDRLAQMTIKALHEACDYDDEAATRLWELTKVTPNTRLDDLLKRQIQYGRDRLRAAQRRYVMRKARSPYGRNGVFSFAAWLIEALDTCDPMSPTIDSEAISDTLGTLEDRIGQFSECLEKNKGLGNVRSQLAGLLHLRRSLHEKLSRVGYAVSNDGYSVARQFVSHPGRCESC